MNSQNIPAITYLQKAQQRRDVRLKSEDNIFKQAFASQRRPQSRTKVNYHQKENKFDEIDIPTYKMTQKLEVLDSIDRDILELKKPKWNSSTLPLHPEMEEPFQRKLMNIKLGLNDGQQMKASPQIIYPGVETRNIYGGWNAATLISKKRSDNFAVTSPDILNMHLGGTKKTNEKLLPLEYRTPRQRQLDYTKFIREQKVEEKPIREQLKDIYKYENPDTSPEKLNAGVFRLNYETKLKAGQLKMIKEDDNYTFSPDISRTVRRNQVIKKYHSGIWTKFSKEKEEGKVKTKWAYSCCQNSDFESGGCCQQVVNKDKPNNLGFFNK